MNQMMKNKDEIIDMVGEHKFNEEYNMLKKIEQQRQTKGEFLAIKGTIDKRSPKLKDIELKPGFEN